MVAGDGTVSSNSYCSICAAGSYDNQMTCSRVLASLDIAVPGKYSEGTSYARQVDIPRKDSIVAYICQPVHFRDRWVLFQLIAMHVLQDDLVLP